MPNRSSPYSQSKPLFHIDRLDALRKGKAPPPVHVHIILSDLCNQDCSFCAYRMSSGLSSEMFGTEKTHNPNRKIPTEKALEILDDCAEMGVKAVQFTGGGEPTVHKDHIKIFGHAQSLGLETALVTNGIRLVPVPEVLRLKWLRVSVDAGREETYTSIRRVNPVHWKKVWINIQAVRDAGYEGVLGVGFVVTPENYRDVCQATWLARKHGADNIRIGAVFSKEGLSFYGDAIEDIAYECEKAARLSSDNFTVIDLFGRRLGDLEGGSPKHPFCGYQYFTTYIGGDLNVYRCCNTAYTPQGLLGNLRETRFKDLVPNWELDARTCTFCMFHGQNEAINAMLEPPEHQNFV